MTDAQKFTETYPVKKSGETRKNSSRNRQEQKLSPTAKHEAELHESCQGGKKRLEERTRAGVGDPEHQENMPHKINGPGLMGAHKGQGTYRGLTPVFCIYALAE